MATFGPPANLTDFDRASEPTDIRKAWHTEMLRLMTNKPASSPAFFDSLNPPAGAQPVVVAPEWTGLPRTIKRLKPGKTAPAAMLVENAIPMGDQDPMFGPFTPQFIRIDNSQPFVGPQYRPQDEYLEWITKKDGDGVITEVIFTCEGPEYWDTIAQLDKALLVMLYKEIVGDNTIQLDELLFPVDVRWNNPNSEVPQTFAAGDYNPFNKRNIEGAVHLTQPANTLGAEVVLARQASLLYGNPAAVTTDPALICCAGYGGANRMSDPTIGSAVNSLVRAGRIVSLRNPIGLYIKDIRLNAITLPNDNPLPPGAQFFEPLRPTGGGEMIVRARFRVPAGVTFNGTQLRVGDLKIAGEQIVTGGQLADLVTMRLFAAHLPGAPAQAKKACVGRPCPDKNRPELIQMIRFNQQCPPGGISPSPLAAPAGAALLAAATAPMEQKELAIEEPFAGLVGKFAVNRRPRFVR